VIFTATKRRNTCAFRFFWLKFESVQAITSVKFVWKRCIKRPDKPYFVTIKLVDAGYFILSTYSKVKAQVFRNGFKFWGYRETVHVCLYFSLQNCGVNCARNERLTAEKWRVLSAFLTTILTTTRLFFSKHLWALCNTLPSIIPYIGSVWYYRNWIKLKGIKTAPNYPVNLRWRVIYWLVRGFRVVDVARIRHVWQIFVKKFRHFFRIKYPLGGLRRMVSLRLISW